MNPALEGVNLYAYGHSYLAENFFGADSGAAVHQSGGPPDWHEWW
jgi:hypothetical protein